MGYRASVDVDAVEWYIIYAFGKVTKQKERELYTFRFQTLLEIRKGEKPPKITPFFTLTAGVPSPDMRRERGCEIS